MKVFKKISILFIAICLLFSLSWLASCTNSDEGAAQENNPPTFAKAVDLAEYTIVIPAEVGTTVKYAAQNLASLIREKTGATLSIVGDDTPLAKKEILIGSTNRQESQVAVELGSMQYLIFMENEKIVMQGSGIYVGAACGDFINKYAVLYKGYTKVDAVNVPTDKAPLTYTPYENAKSVIFMIGDGMGENHVLMAEGNGLDGFVAKEFPFLGESVTRSLSVISGESGATDSAASGTAMSTGYKTINGYIGIDKNGERLLNVRELAALSGAKTGVITTDVITGATPSAYLCHQLSRNDSEELTSQIEALVANGEIDYCKGEVAEELTNELKAALDTLSKDGSTFFLMLEEGLIDKASHSKLEKDAMDYVIRFDDAIEYATQFALCHPDVALVVTADHETGKLLEVPKKTERWPYGYAFRSDAHTNVNVPIYAIGAGTAVFNGVVIENIELARFCAKAFSAEPFGQAEPVE